MFYGQFHHQLDDKGRLRIPPAFRKLLGDNPMIFCSFEKCLFLYKGEDFDKLVKERFMNADLLDTDMNDIKPRNLLPRTSRAGFRSIRRL